MMLQFDTDIAAEHGIQEAVLIEFFRTGIKGNIGKKAYFFEGKNWASVTDRDLKASLPMFSPKTIAGLIASLLQKGILICGHVQDSKYSWYSFQDEGFWLADVPPVTPKSKKKKKLTEEEAFMNTLPVGLVEGKQRSLYERMMSTYYQWHKQIIGVEPAIDGREGKALKALVTYFLKIAINRAKIHCSNTGEALTQELIITGANTAWGNLLAGLQTASIDPFLKKQKKISQIYNNLTNIIDQLRNGKGKPQGQQPGQQQSASSPKQQKRNSLSELEREVALASGVAKY